MSVIYKDIEGFPGYKVSNIGTVISYWKKGDNNSILTENYYELSATITGNGYPQVALRNNGRRVSKDIHILVLEAFVGPKPHVNLVARHYPDQDRTNNRLENLSWATREVNEADRIEHGTTNRGERNCGSILTEKDVLEIRSLITVKTMLDIARQFGVSQSTISRIINRVTWRHI